ncbi:response regulator [Taibaiella helva]|uniref:response regulator n=1 Tax=Taibaiella helva TaxID=2301235 RepID=UPI0018E53C5E|nr:response regulator transcription factor [Taibaiella helva]
MPISVSIVDDHPLATSGVSAMLEGHGNIVVRGVYHSAASLMDGLSVFSPDVLLLDILIPGQSGKALAPVIRQQHPSVKIVVLTSLDAPAMVSSMMRRGCSGYLLKDTDRQNLIAAIETVYTGKEFIDPSLKEKILAHVLHPGRDKDDVVPEITKREMQILKLIAEENTTREISEKLYISFRTVENHRYSLLQKLDVKNTVGLVKVALKLGLVK